MKQAVKVGEYLINKLTSICKTYNEGHEDKCRNGKMGIIGKKPARNKKKLIAKIYRGGMRSETENTKT